MTGVRIVYVATELMDGSGTTPVGSSELDEVRWVGVAEAGKLMGDMANVVRQYLARVLGLRSRSH